MEKKEEAKTKEEIAREKELQQIKNAYLGVKKEKKKAAKISEKFRFAFDWGAEEDTSADLNPLYDKKHEALLLFGRAALSVFADAPSRTSPRERSFFFYVGAGCAPGSTGASSSRGATRR